MKICDEMLKAWKSIYAVKCSHMNFFFSFRTELNEEWAFATKMTDLSENGEVFDTEMEIFDVKLLGDMDVDEPRSEKLTAQTIKSIIAKAKG